MYKLYWARASGAMVPQALFEEIGAKYEKIVIDLDQEENRTPEFLAVNPMGQIPVLVLPDGTLMTESAAMVLHIADPRTWSLRERELRKSSAPPQEAGEMPLATGKKGEK